MSEARSVDAQLDGAIDAPAVAQLYEVMARGNLDDHTIDTAVDGTFDVLDHAARQDVDGARKPAVDDLPNRLLVVGRNRGHARFDAMYTDVREGMGNAYFVSRLE